jgi:hypothetical protein
VKTILAAIGLGVVLLAILGMFGIGNFVLYYSFDEISCMKF